MASVLHNPANVAFRKLNLNLLVALVASAGEGCRIRHSGRRGGTGHQAAQGHDPDHEGQGLRPAHQPRLNIKHVLRPRPRRSLPVKAVPRLSGQRSPETSQATGGGGGAEFADVVLGAGGLEAGEDADRSVAECETVVEVAGIEVGGPDDGESHADGGDRRAERRRLAARGAASVMTSCL
jgi:hypothetical protein